jgi:DNA-binding response OmpR family regulator
MADASFQATERRILMQSKANQLSKEVGQMPCIMPSAKMPARREPVSVSPRVLVLARDPLLRRLVASNCDSPWSVEMRENLDSIWELADGRHFALVVLDDELLPANERGLLLNRVRRVTNRAPLLYVGSSTDAEVERGVRCDGLVCYISKPLEPVKLAEMLKAWLGHLLNRERRSRV